MAFTETYLDPQRWTEFSFFTDVGVDGAISESIAPGKPFKIHEFRIHNSIAIASVGDLVIRLSAAQGSAHNMVFVSKAMLGSTDYWLLFSNPLIFQSGDQVVVTFSMASAANVMGLNVVGWAVRG